MERVGVLGLGRMGRPIAMRLRDAGHPVCAFDPLERAPLGVVAAADEGAVARGSDVLVTILPGPRELREAMLGTGGALQGLAPGSCWLDLTSNDPRVAAEVAAAADSRGVLSVGAPMAGGPSDAALGTLGFFVGGADAAVDRVLPVLRALGPETGSTRTGTDVGSAFTTKLLVNTLWFGQVIAVTEVLLLAQSLGLDVAQLSGTLAASAGGSSFITDHLDALLSGDYLTTFALPRVVEELDTVRDLAEEAGTPHDLTALVARMHTQALDRFGPVDGELMAAKLLEERAGRTLRVNNPPKTPPSSPGRRMDSGVGGPVD